MQKLCFPKETKESAGCYSLEQKVFEVRIQEAWSVSLSSLCFMMWRFLLMEVIQALSLKEKLLARLEVSQIVTPI